MVRVHVLPPLPRMLGLSETSGDFTEEVDLDPDANVYDLFRQLALKYPAFSALVDAGSGDRFQPVMVSVDGRLITRTDYEDTILGDRAEVHVFPLYRGG